MSLFYAFHYEELAMSKKNVEEAIGSEPFIFVPSKTASRHGSLVSGSFLHPEEVYWDDPTGSFHEMKLRHQRSSSSITREPLNKALCNVYPGLHDFFVSQCGVRESPSLCGYLDILRQLTALAPPSEAASAVLKVFLKWNSEFKYGLLSSEDLIHLKECLMKLEYAILPTAPDKWMSLHPSFGLLCWCDNTELSSDFKHLDNINFLYFDTLNDKDKEILRNQMSQFFKELGIPALSEVITRQAIYYGPSDSSFKSSLVDWALPYAQRYMHGIHATKYNQLKQNGFETVKKLEIIVVEKLFYKNVIRSCGKSSRSRYECSCLLQDETLYSTVAADPHALFLELSRLFFNGFPDLHLANFLHMVTTMAESGSTVEQTEFFILNSQKISKLPDEEAPWSLSSAPASIGSGESLTTDIVSMSTDGEDKCLVPSEVSALETGSKSSRYQIKAGFGLSWPPADWKTAPRFDPHARDLTTQASTSFGLAKDPFNDDVKQMECTNNGEWTIREDPGTLPTPACESTDNHMGIAREQTHPAYGTADPARFSIMPDRPEPMMSLAFPKREQFNITAGGSNEHTAATGRLGEELAFRYLKAKYGEEAVRWVNEQKETGLPYDIRTVGKEHGGQYFEVKATESVRKDWFFISGREWQMAAEKGDAYTIVHVLLGNHNAKVSLFRNPVKLCQQGNLRLIVVMPNQLPQT